MAEPVIVELREWSRINEQLKRERIRLTNRMRDQLWRYYPQILELVDDDLAADWLLALWELVPTPEKAARVRETTIARVLKKHRVRRFDAAHVLSELRKPALTVAQGTIEAATAHIRVAIEQLSDIAPHVVDVLEAMVLDGVDDRRDVAAYIQHVFGT